MNEGGGLFGIGGEVVDSRDDARRIEMPFDEEAIGGHAAMERAGGDAVKIGDVMAADGAETIEIKVRVLGFERVESPLDKTDATSEGVFALEELEQASNSAIAMRGEHARHVGM